MNCRPEPEITCGTTINDSCVIFTGAWPSCFSTQLGDCYRQADFNLVAGTQICANLAAITDLQNQLGYTGELALSGCTGFVPANTTIKAEFQALYSSLCVFQYNLDQPINTGQGGIALKCLQDPCGVPIGSLGQLLQALINCCCTSESGGDKTYEATLTQNVTGSPIAVVLENTLDTTNTHLVFTRTGVGTYVLTASGGVTFPVNKTTVFVGSPRGISFDILAYVTSTTTISIETYASGIAADTILDQTSLKIKTS